MVVIDLANIQPVAIEAGETLRVVAHFVYDPTGGFTIATAMGVYEGTASFPHLNYQTNQDVTFPATAVQSSVDVTYDLVIPSDTTNGQRGVAIFAPDGSVAPAVKLDGILTVSGGSGGTDFISSLINLIIVMMMMQIMTGMMSGMDFASPKRRPPEPQVRTPYPRTTVYETEADTSVKYPMLPQHTESDWR